jgi:hypothetical protein
VCEREKQTKEMKKKKLIKLAILISNRKRREDFFCRVELGAASC